MYTDTSFYECLHLLWCDDTVAIIGRKQQVDGLKMVLHRHTLGITVCVQPGGVLSWLLCLMAVGLKEQSGRLVTEVAQAIHEAMERLAIVSAGDFAPDIVSGQ